MTQTPSRSPLFPYTTLFRSAGRHDDALLERLAATGAGAVLEVRAADDLDLRCDLTPKAGTSAEKLREEAEEFVALARLFTQDRKSTRLNSSHANISYAVFCLNDTDTIEISTLSLHDALPICREA